MDSKTIAGIALCIVFYLGYDQYLKKKYPDYGKPPIKTEQPVSETTSTNPAPAAESVPVSGGILQDGESTPAVAIKKLSSDELTFETDTNIYRFSQETGALESVSLKKYAAGKAKGSGMVELLHGPLIINGVVYNANEPIDPIKVASASVKAGNWSAERQGRSLRFWAQKGPWEIAQEFRIPESGYAAEVDIIFTNKSDKPIDAASAMSLHKLLSTKAPPKILGFLPGAPGEVQSLVQDIGNKAEHIDVLKHCQDNDELAIDLKDEPLEFFGIDSRYFLQVFEPKAKTSSLKARRVHADDDNCNIALVNYQSNGLVQPGESVRMSYDTYFGPKDMSILQTYNDKLANTINLGFFGFIAKPLLAVIHGFYKFFGNYGLSIILLTVLLKILFYPLMKASAVSMHRMKKLNPQMNELKEKFKDDKARQQQELMKFMAANKVNPMKGCLPILPQIPVFFAFYQVLQMAIELRHAPFYGWIQDLSSMDPYFVTPLLMGVAMLVQQKLTPTTGMDKTQEKILMFMPIMFTAMMLTLPAGMTLYMLTNTVFGIMQQKWLYRKLDKLEA